MMEPETPTSEGQDPPETGRLRRSRDDRVIAGICGGLGAYFGVDPVWFRLAFVVLALGGGSGVLFYLVGWVIIPEQQADEPLARGPASIGDQGPVIVGVALVAIGLMLLFDNLIPWFDRVMWPLVVIAAGVALVYTGSRRGRG